MKCLVLLHIVLRSLLISRKILEIYLVLAARTICLYSTVGPQYLIIQYMQYLKKVPNASMSYPHIKFIVLKIVYWTWNQWLAKMVWVLFFISPFIYHPFEKFQNLDPKSVTFLTFYAFLQHITESLSRENWFSALGAILSEISAIKVWKMETDSGSRSWNFPFISNYLTAKPQNNHLNANVSFT